MLTLQVDIVKLKEYGNCKGVAYVDGAKVAEAELTFLLLDVVMLNRVLIANRGEIACRIIRAA